MIRSATRKRLSIILFLSIIIVAALWLRLNNIGKFGFWFDEYLHVFAAKSLLSEKTLYIPFYGDYTRAQLVTYITAASFKYFGESEASARLPFVLINVLFIIIGYVYLRHLFSDKIALLFAFVMSFSPYAIEYARDCRMYAAFQLVYFTMSLTFFLGFECTIDRSKSKLPKLVKNFESKYGVRLSLLILALCLLWVSSSLHRLSYNFGFVVITYCIILFFYEMFVSGLSEALSSKYALALLITALCVIVVAVFKREFFASMWAMSQEIRSWATLATRPSYYRWQLQAGYPSLLYLYPVGAFCLIKSYGKKGLFVVVSFLILILLHSFWFARINIRYIFYIFPFFIIGAAAAFERLILPLLSPLFAQMQLKSKWESVLFVVLAIPAICLFLYPWFSHSRFVSRSPKEPDWKTFPAKIRNEISDANVITTDPWAFKYYFGKDPSYYFVPEDERASTFNYGNKLVTSFEHLKSIVDTNPKVLVIGENYRFYNKAFLDDSMRDYISTNMEKLEGLFDNRIVVYKKGF